MQCPSCGSANFEGATFCSLCMKPLSEGEGGEAVPAPAPSAEPAASQGLPAQSAPGQAGYSPADVRGTFAGERSAEAPAAPRRARVPVGLIIAIAVLAVALGGAALLGRGSGELSEAELAVVPVPPGSQLIATQEAVTEGPAGPLNEERRAVYATRVYLVPMSVGDAMAYYRQGGAGAGEIATLGWSGPTGYVEELTYFEGMWTRRVTAGLVSKEDQSCRIRVQGDTLGGGIIEIPKEPAMDPFSQLQSVTAAAVPGESCIVAIGCRGASLLQVEFVER